MGIRNYRGCSDDPTGVVTGFSTALAFPESTPGHCVNADDGNVWCSNTGGPLLRVSATTGASTVFDLPAGAGAMDLTLGPDGALWFADAGLNQIGRMTLTGTVTEFPLPPTFGAPRSITVGPDRALWFTGDHKVGRLDATGNGFRSYDLTDTPIGAIAAGPDGNLWLGVATTPNLSSQSVAKVTLGGQVTEYPLPNPHSTGVLDIVAGPDGAMWFTDEQANEIERITTAGVLTEYPLQPLSGPVGITVGWDRAIWFTELAGRIGRLSGGPLAPAPVPTLTPALLALLVATLAATGWLLLRSK